MPSCRLASAPVVVSRASALLLLRLLRLPCCEWALRPTCEAVRFIWCSCEAATDESSWGDVLGRCERRDERWWRVIEEGAVSRGLASESLPRLEAGVGQQQVQAAAARLGYAVRRIRQRAAGGRHRGARTCGKDSKRKEKERDVVGIE